MLLALRRPHELVAAQFWAEDGAIFFSQRLAFGPWHSIFVPYNGYQHLIPRLIAAAAAPFPVAWAPEIYTWCALAIAAASCSLFALPAFRHLIRTDAVRYVCCLVFAAVPFAGEELDNVANLQWYVSVPALLLLVLPRRSLNALAPLALLALALLEFIFAMSAPVTVLYFPLALRRLAGGSWRTRAIPFALLAGGTIEIVQWIAAAGAGAQPHAGNGALLRAAMITFAYRIELALTTGWELTQTLSQRGELLVAGALTLLSLLVLWVVVREAGSARVRRLVLFGAFLLVAGTLVPLRERDLVGYFQPDATGMAFWGAERYFMLGSALFIFLSAFCIEEILRPRTHGTVRALLVAALFCLGALSNFRLADRHDFDWPREAVAVEAWQNAKSQHRATASVALPINPAPFTISLPSEPGESR